MQHQLPLAACYTCKARFNLEAHWLCDSRILGAHCRQTRIANADPETMANRVNQSVGSKALYLYGISSHTSAPPKVKGEGIDGKNAVELLEYSGLDCWISRV